MKTLALRIIVALVGLASYPIAHAGAIEDLTAIDFSLRFPAALAKFAPYGDVAGSGGASAGSRYSTSINPAATDWMASLERPFSVSPQYSRIRFDNGPTLNISGLAAGVSTEHMGSFLPAAVRIRNDGRPEGDYLLIQGDYTQIQWGKRLQEDLAIGATISYSSFTTKAGFGGELVADGNSDTTGVRAGILWAASKQLLAGLVIDYSRARSSVNAFDLGCFCFLQLTDTSNAEGAHAGVSYEYAEQSSVYVDYLYGRFRNSQGSLSSNALQLGVEHRFLPWLFGRAGVTHDFRGFSASTIGIGVTPTKGTAIDIAIQHDMFPELRPEFGHSKLLNISLSLTF